MPAITSPARTPDRTLGKKERLLIRYINPIGLAHWRSGLSSILAFPAGLVLALPGRSRAGDLQQFSRILLGFARAEHSGAGHQHVRS